MQGRNREQVRKWLAAGKQEVLRYRREEAVETLLMDAIPAHAVPANAIPELYDFARQTIGDVPVIYLEFGVFGGRSMTRMANRFTHPDSRFVGFDSFEGLPEAWNSMATGTFSRKGALPNIDDPRVAFVKGWFQNTLPDFLKSNALLKKPLLVHFDADLYSSTLFILSTLWHYVDEYHFIFDEFMSEEIMAMHDFKLAYPIKYEFMAQTNAGGYPTQIFGRMNRCKLDLQSKGAAAASDAGPAMLG